MTATLEVWSWRQAVARARLDPITKLVLYTLGNYMNEHGSGCYPSISTIMDDACLARATVIKHIGLAEQAGFVRRHRHGYGGQQWKRQEYHATYPEGYNLRRDPHAEIPQEKGGLADEPPPQKVVQPVDQGGSPDEQKVVQPVNPNSPVEHSNNAPGAREIFDELMEVWDQLCGNTLGKSALLTARARDAVKWRLEHHFGNDLAKWRDYCGMVARSPFLLGDGPSKWKPDLTWLTDPENIAKVRSGKYRVGRSGADATPQLPLDTPPPAPREPMTLETLGGDTPQNREFMKIMTALRADIGDTAFISWMEPVQIGKRNCSVLTLTSPTRFMRDWINTHYAHRILERVRQAWPEIETIRIEVRQ